MGWKASCILINERGPGYLGTMPPHDPQRARRLIEDLGLGPCRSRGLTTFDEGLYPDHLVLGAYDGATVIGTPDLINSSERIGRNLLILRVLNAFPKATVLSVCLHSVVNLFGYASFEDGVLIRAYGGSAEDGVVVDQGELLPEEQPHFEHSIVRDGKRLFYADIGGRMAEFSAEAYGETLAFEGMARFFGCRIGRDHPWIDPFALTMEAFERVPPKPWWWPIEIGSLVEKAYRGKPMSPVRLICGEKPGGIGLTPDALCPMWRRLLDWFRGHYADEGLDLTKLTAETTFRDISTDSLDDVEWLIEAEERFGVVIPDADAARMKTVGDYLRYIRLCIGGDTPSAGWSARPSERSDPMWDRQVDA